MKKLEFCLFLLNVVLFLPGCISISIKEYDGPLPTERDAVIEKQANLSVAHLDGKDLRGVQSWEEFYWITVKPGKHTIGVSFRYQRSQAEYDAGKLLAGFLFGPYPSVGNYKPKAYCIPFQELSFTTVAGHQYLVETGYVDSSNELVIRIEDVTDDKLLTFSDPDKKC